MPKLAGQGRPCPYLCNVEAGYRWPPLNFRNFFSNWTKLGEDVKGVRKTMRSAFRAPSRMSGRRTVVFFGVTVHLDHRYSYRNVQWLILLFESPWQIISNGANKIFKTFSGRLGWQAQIFNFLVFEISMKKYFRSCSFYLIVIKTWKFSILCNF